MQFTKRQKRVEKSGANRKHTEFTYFFHPRKGIFWSDHWLQMNFSTDIVFNGDGKHEFRIKGDFVYLHYNEAPFSALKALKTLRIGDVTMQNVGVWVVGQQKR